MIREKEMVSNFLSDAGYAYEEINRGFDYADSIGWSTADQLGQLTLSKILLTECQLADGELVGWSPVDWPKDDN